MKGSHIDQSVLLDDGQAYVDGTLACEAELMLVLAKDKK